MEARFTYLPFALTDWLLLLAMIQIRSAFNWSSFEAQEAPYGGRPPNESDDAWMLWHQNPSGAKWSCEDLKMMWSHLDCQVFFCFFWVGFFFLPSQKKLIAHLTLVFNISVLLYCYWLWSLVWGSQTLHSRNVFKCPHLNISLFISLRGRGWKKEGKLACQHKFSASSGKTAALQPDKTCVPPTADNSLKRKLFVGFTFQLQENVWLCNYTWNAVRFLRNCIVLCP